MQPERVGGRRRDTAAVIMDRKHFCIQCAVEVRVEDHTVARQSATLINAQDVVTR
eukprot:CAMPEP_0119328362 /NCGR_PEP_ID=MMETSP1333-20130426/73141_1 /TAXON_ID=418940 /ORGANISM="Scyphosphaera apsteinii, Strain RCC1455" /LENGTH=54 /DNA_ID=CAMNT_0007337187 /DNA_START=1 /DNA_END=162 /DNA_ORIENTATION=-